MAGTLNGLSDTALILERSAGDAAGQNLTLLIEFNAAPETIKTLEIAYRRDEKVLRFLTVKMEKYAAEYAAKRRSNKQPKEQEA